MNAGGRPRAGSYARAVERHWSELCGRPVVFSPRDWALIEDWHQRGIPLQIVREAIDAAAERRKGSSPTAAPRGLAYIARAVEDAWQVVVEGRLVDAAASIDGPSEEAGGIEAWRDCRGRQPPGSRLGRLLDELIQAFEHGAPTAELESRLDDQLADAAPRELRARAESEVAAELKPYEHRMTSESFESTRRKVVMRRLRMWLGLPALAGA